MPRLVPLFRIKISHQYYTDSEQRDLMIGPSTHTLTLMKRYRLRFRRTPEGGEVYYQENDAGNPIIPISNIPDLQCFTFWVRVLNPHFVTYTSFDKDKNVVVPIRNRIMYFDSDSGNTFPAVGPPEEVNLLPGTSMLFSDGDGDLGGTSSIYGEVEAVTDAGDAIDPNNIVGTQDDTVTQLIKDGGYMIVELGNAVPPGATIRVRGYRDSGQGRLRVEGSEDNGAGGYTLLGQGNLPGPTGPGPGGGTSTVWHDLTYSVPATLTAGMKFVRLTNFTSPGASPTTPNRNVFIDCVDYNFPTPFPAVNYTHHIPKMLDLVNPIYHFTDTPGGSGTKKLEILDCNDNVVTSFDLAIDGGKIDAQLDLRPYPRGRVGFQYNNDPSPPTYLGEVYVEEEFRHEGYLGAIEIKKNSDFDSIPTNDTPIEYTIDFTSRRRTWRIFVVQKSDVATTPTYALRDDEGNLGTTRYAAMHFRDITGAGATVDGHDARVYITVKASSPTVPHAIRYFEESKPLIGLYEDGSFANRIRESLRNPPVESISTDDDGHPTNDTYRDVYIFI
ncbi:MAG: hypothetical protein AAF570_14960 [Bacteroidota bacterium]